MSAKLEFSPRAARDLQGLDRKTVARIIQALEEFVAFNRGDVKKLRGKTEEWRLRVGDYRVRFEQDAERLLVTVLKAAHRREAYRD
ncbi:Plasmid stabilization system protein [compost metagenome]